MSTPSNDDDVLKGTPGPDLINGLGGNDEIYGFDGKDIIDGGEGDDLVVLQGSRKEYIISANDDGSFVITDTIPERDGIDILYHVEKLLFSADGWIEYLISRSSLSISSNGAGDAASVGIAENDTIVTKVTADYQGSVTALTYSISGGADAALFQINAGTGALSFRSAPNFEAPADADANNVYDVIVQVSDGTLSDTQAIAVTVTNVNEAPSISSNGAGATASVSIAENSIAVTTVTATDPDAGTALTYSISGGADAALFQINASTGALSFRSVPNFEAPADAGANNVYDVIVQVSDGTLSDTQAIAVTVTNVNETPAFAAAAQSVSATEDTPKAITLAANDVDGDALTYTAGVPARGSVTISGSTATYTPVANFNGSDSFIVTASDGKGGTSSQTINISVAAVNDAPTFAAAAQTVSATAGAAKTITLAATDVDGDTLTYTVATPSKGTASISGNTLTYTPGSASSGSDTFVVTASDGKGGTATQTITAAIATAAAAKAFSVYATSGWVGSIGGNGTVYGTNGFEDITVLFGQVALDGSFNRGGDILRVSGNAETYDIGRVSASSAYIEAGTTTKVAIPIGSAGLGVVFADGVRKLSFSSGAYKIGSQTFAVNPAKISAATDGTVLPTGADPAAQAIIYMNTEGLSGGLAADLTISGKARIFGTNAVDVIKLGGGSVDLTFDGTFNRGGDIIILDKAAGDYAAAKLNASTIVITSTGEKLSIPMGSAGLTLRFTDGDRTLVFKSGAFYIGDQSITSTTATSLTPSSITISADQGVPGSSVILDGTGKVIFTDDATKTTNVILKNFGTDDVIRVSGATASQYSFAISNVDAKDLEITYTDASTSATNSFVLDDVIKIDAFIENYQTAASALGWNFMTFG